MYRPNIRNAIFALIEKANGKTLYGDRISVTLGKGKFSVLRVSKSGIKDGWYETTHLYTQKAVEHLNDVITKQ